MKNYLPSKFNNLLGLLYVQNTQNSILGNSQTPFGVLTAQYFIFKVQLSASIHNLSFVIDLSDFVSEFLRRKNFIVSLHFAPPVKV